MDLKRIAKFVAALAGVAAQVVASGLVDGAAREWMSQGIAILTAVAVFLVPNETATPPLPQPPGAANPS